MKFVSTTLIFVSISSLIFGQFGPKAASYTTSLDFERRAATDSFRYDRTKLYDPYRNESYRLFPIQKEYGTIHLTNTVLIVYDGVDLYLNVKKLRISKGFMLVRVNAPRN